MFHPIGPFSGSAYEILISWEEYYVLGWTVSPLEYLLNVANMFMQSLLDLMTHGSGHHHDSHPSTSTLIIQSLQQRTLATDVTLPRHRGNPDRGQPYGSYTTTQTL